MGRVPTVCRVAALRAHPHPAGQNGRREEKVCGSQHGFPGASAELGLVGGAIVQMESWEKTSE